MTEADVGQSGMILGSHYHSQSMCIMMAGEPYVNRTFASSTFANVSVFDEIKDQISTIANLSHPNLVPFTSLQEDGQLCRIRRPYVKGRNVSGLLIEVGHLSISDAFRYAIEVGETIVFLHENDIPCGTLRPENVIINSAGKPILVDYGIDAILGDTVDHPSITTNYAYMGPEGITTQLTKPTKELDAYHYGVFIYELFNGKFPWGNSLPNLLKSVSKGEITSQPNVPAGVAQLIEQLINPVISERCSVDKAVAQLKLIEASIGSIKDKMRVCVKPPKPHNIDFSSWARTSKPLCIPCVNARRKSHSVVKPVLICSNSRRMSVDKSELHPQMMAPFKFVRNESSCSTSRVLHAVMDADSCSNLAKTVGDLL